MFEGITLLHFAMCGKKYMDEPISKSKDGYRKK